MPQRPHLRITVAPTTEDYTYPIKGGGGGTFLRPPREPAAHSANLREQLQEVENQVRAVMPDEDEELPGVTLEFQGEHGFRLWLESLEDGTRGIELLNARMEAGVPLATVHVPPGKLGHFLRLVDKYATTVTTSGRAHDKLVESITEVRRATLRSFWTDAPELFPADNRRMWWEVWLRAPRGERGDQVVQQFRMLAEESGLRLGTFDIVRFAERAVVLSWGLSTDWTRQPDLLDLLAELRRAKELPTPYVTLPPRGQLEFVNELLGRTTAPSPTAPAVCVLDTGVQQAHPLLSIALDPADTLTVKAEWNTADHLGHGTEMAGLAIYGCLTEALTTAGPIVLRHRLESVKLLPPVGDNDPKNYGALTQQAAFRVEIQNPQRARVLCLAVTATDDRDEGFPSSWSAAIDQLSSGELDDFRRLVVVSAGNCRLLRDATYEYPRTNHESSGIQDPSQSWNALTVGAFTNRVVVQSPEWRGWQPIASAGLLAPSSTTSLPWSDTARPLKPDVVFEGGNWVKSQGGQVDCCDDVSLLTTARSDLGRLFTTTGETSAAAAQAARMAAMIEGHYPELWPETVRGLIIHSAQWTTQMLNQFPRVQRARRLRCYGFGVPDLGRAIRSVNNAATLVFEGELQPFTKNEAGRIVTKDMHFHELPWPVDVLRQLGAAPVRMHVTLSYFIEPNPGRRGWRKKHRYQSHGLRFAVKRPTDSPTVFRQRMTREAWDDFDQQPAAQGDDHQWHLGRNLRTLGSIHSDWWEGTATDLAACGTIGVFPVTGWWRERRGQERWNRSARYSLLVTLSSPRQDVDLYTPISNLVGVAPLVDISIDA